MTIRYIEQQKDVSVNSVEVKILSKTLKHTIACEGTSGDLITITATPVGMTVAQTILNNVIDLTSPEPLYVEGTVESFTLTRTGANPWTYSITGE